MNKVFLALMALLLASPATAQQPGGGNNDTSFSTPGNGFVQGIVQMCRNTAGLAVPCSSGVAGAGGLPGGATPVFATSSGTTAGTTATLAAAAGKFTYVCGASWETGTATAAITINLSVGTVVSGGTFFTTSANAPATAATATAGPIVSQTFTPCLPASAVNTSISASAGALGAGGVNQLVNVWGFQL